MGSIPIRPVGEMVMEERVESTVSFICPVTMKSVEMKVSNSDIAGFCENSEFPSEHFIEVHCPECKKFHRLS
jgi:hypothetical protein